MSIVKNGIFKVSNLVIAGILSLLGFGFSCESKDEYGCPWASYKVTGKVVSSVDQTKISNVEVVLTELYYESDSVAYTGDSNVVNTASDGAYEVQLNTIPDNEKYFKLAIKDIDGEDNGSYVSKDTVISFNDSELTGGSGWYSGEATKEINIELDPE